MPETTFSLRHYDGPATINGVEFTAVRINEHASSEGGRIRKGWDGVATVPRSDAPTITPEWMDATAREDVINVRLPGSSQRPDGYTGRARPTNATYVDDDGFRYWRISFAGIGPSPWDGDA